MVPFRVKRTLLTIGAAVNRFKKEMQKKAATELAADALSVFTMNP
jgi:hypothetical protein